MNLSGLAITLFSFTVFVAPVLAVQDFFSRTSQVLEEVFLPHPDSRATAEEGREPGLDALDGLSGRENRGGLERHQRLARLRDDFLRHYQPKPECRQPNLEWHRLMRCKNDWTKAYLKYAERMNLFVR